MLLMFMEGRIFWHSNRVIKYWSKNFLTLPQGDQVFLFVDTYWSKNPLTFRQGDQVILVNRCLRDFLLQFNRIHCFSFELNLFTVSREQSPDLSAGKLDNDSSLISIGILVGVNCGSKQISLFLPKTVVFVERFSGYYTRILKFPIFCTTM